MTPRRLGVLPSGEVHLWKSRLDAPPEQLVAWEAVLSDDERARAERLRRPLDRTRWIAARGTLRQVLSRYVPAEPAVLRFRSGARGKPALDPETPDWIRFNLSHSAELLLVAVARGREVGVDVERADSPRAWERIARRFFSPCELRALAAAPPDRRQHAFVRIWTRREALGKALGEGVFHSLRGIESVPDNLVPGPPADEGTHFAGWWLYESEPAPGYVAALAVEGSACAVVHRSPRASPPIESIGRSGTAGGTDSLELSPDHHA
ncbi:4'-phosphopantetheinyl transferase superfamily protein [soil metagenome]